MQTETFELHRDVDHSGLSGTGVVADGAVFPDGTTVLRWRETNNGDLRPTTAVFESVASVEATHGHGGSTRIVWTTRNLIFNGRAPHA